MPEPLRGWPQSSTLSDLVGVEGKRHWSVIRLDLLVMFRIVMI